MKLNLSEKFTSLRSRLGVIFLISVIPPLLLLTLSYFQLRENEKEKAENEALRILRLSASNEERLIEGARQLLITFSKDKDIRQGNFSQCNENAKFILDQFPFYTALGVVDNKGKIVCSGMEFDPDTNVSDRRYIQQVLQTNDFAVGQYQIGRVSNLPSVNFGYPILDPEGEVKYIAVAGLGLSWLSNLSEEVEFRSGSTLTLMDENGRILFRQPDNEFWLGKSVPESEIYQVIIQQQSEGIVEAKGIDGVEKLIAFTPLSIENRTGTIYLHLGLPTKIAYQNVNRIFLFNLIGFVIIITSAFVIVWFGGYLFIVKNIQKLLVSVKFVSEGNYDSVKLDEKSQKGEIGELNSSFYQMAVQLKQRDEDQKRINSVLKNQLRSESELEQKGRDFISVASHQLLTPLALIRGYLLMLLSQKYAKVDKSALEFAQESAKGVDRMSKLVKDLLSSSRIENNSLPLKKKNFNLTYLISDCTKQFQLKAKQKNLELLYPEEGQILVFADPDLTAEVLSNLVDNAIKFTDEGLVSIMVRDKDDKFAEVAVRDTGVGIKKEIQNKIFEKFFFSESWIKRERESTGLGLYICKSLIELMGGKINVISAEGKGSTFIFTLPKAKNE